MKAFDTAWNTVRTWACVLLLAGCQDSKEVMTQETCAPTLRIMMPYQIDSNEFIGARIELDGTGRGAQQVPMIIAVGKDREDVSKLISSSVMQTRDVEPVLARRFVLNAAGKIVLQDLDSSDLIVMMVRDGVASASLHKGKGKNMPANLVEGDLIQEVLKLYDTLDDADRVQIIQTE